MKFIVGVCLVVAAWTVKAEDSNETTKAQQSGGKKDKRSYYGELAYGAPPLSLPVVPQQPHVHQVVPWQPIGRPAVAVLPQPGLYAGPGLVTRHVPVAVPHPVPVPVERHVPVHVPHPVPYPVHVVRNVAVPVDRPVAVPVDRPVPYPVYRNVPVHVPVDRPVPVHVPVQVPVHVPVDRPYPVPVDRPVAVPVLRNIPVPVDRPVPVHVPVQVPVDRPVPVPVPQAFPVDRPVPVPVPLPQPAGFPVFVQNRGEGLLPPPLPVAGASGGVEGGRLSPGVNINVNGGPEGTGPQRFVPTENEVPQDGGYHLLPPHGQRLAHHRLSHHHVKPVREVIHEHSHPLALTITRHQSSW